MHATSYWVSSTRLESQLCILLIFDDDWEFELLIDI